MGCREVGCWDVVGLVPRAELGLCLLPDHAERGLPSFTTTDCYHRFSRPVCPFTHQPIEGHCQALTVPVATTSQDIKT